jgi:hypothetical protein
MKLDLLADDLPLTAEKARAAREARSPMAQLGWLVAVALIGFSGTSAAIWFGPRAVEYLREVASRSSAVAPKTAARTVPNPQPFWVSGNPLVIQPPSIPQFNLPQWNGLSAPFPGGGGSSSRFTIHR